MGLIIDTSAIVALERNRLGLERILAVSGSEPVAIPAVVWAELLVGVRMARNMRIAARRRARLEKLRLLVPVVDFDAAIAEHYADIYAECTKRGKMIPQNDMAVAATARHLGYDVLAGPQGERHFQSVEGLRVVVLPA